MVMWKWKMESVTDIPSVLIFVWHYNGGHIVQNSQKASNTSGETQQNGWLRHIACQHIHRLKRGAISAR